MPDLAAEGTALNVASILLCKTGITSTASLSGGTALSRVFRGEPGTAQTCLQFAALCPHDFCLDFVWTLFGFTHSILTTALRGRHAPLSLPLFYRQGARVVLFPLLVVQVLLAVLLLLLVFVL